MKTIKFQLPKQVEQLQQYLSERSPREKALAGGALGLLFIAVVAFVLPSVQDMFHRQSAQLGAARKDLKDLPAAYARYLELSGKKTALEESFQQTQVKEDEVRPYLERLVNSTAEIKEGFRVEDPQDIPIGANYRRLFVRITNLKVTNFQKFAEFLDQIVNGEKSFMLEEIRIQKSGTGDSLLASVNVSKIEKRS